MLISIWCYNGLDLSEPEGNNIRRVIWRKLRKKHAASRGFLATTRLLFIVAHISAISHISKSLSEIRFHTDWTNLAVITRMHTVLTVY